LSYKDEEPDSIMPRDLPKALHRLSVRASITIAMIAWATVFLGFVVPAPREERLLAMLVVGVGWPLVYGFALGGCWVLGLAAVSTEPMGPAKDLQRKLMRTVFVWWLNVVIILVPGAALVVAILGLTGVFPASEGVQ
jgi:hypothetical protein